MPQIAEERAYRFRRRSQTFCLAHKLIVIQNICTESFCERTDLTTSMFSLCDKNHDRLSHGCDRLDGCGWRNRSHGCDGRNGRNGRDGSDGRNGCNGRNWRNRSDGRDGRYWRNRSDGRYW